MIKAVSSCARTLRATSMVLSLAAALALSFVAALSDEADAAQIVLTSGTSWTVPSDWNSDANKIEVVGGGGGGGSASATVGGGGAGGGAYSAASNVGLTPGSVVSYQVGLGGTGGNGATGGNTWFNGTSAPTATVSAQGGLGGVNGVVGISAIAGGAAANGNGTIKYSGGNGGAAYQSGGGGGGAGGPHGNGGAGGFSQSGIGGLAGGGGGGGADGGTAGGSGSAASSGAGGLGWQGNGGYSGNCVGGDSGGGGSGGLPNSCRGGVGGMDRALSSTLGLGGGGGGGGSNYPASPGRPGGDAGSYGGGGGGAGSGTALGGNGGNGIIVITYTPRGAAPTQPQPPTPNASATRTSSFAYNATSGLLIQEVVEPDTPALRLQTDYTYDTFGNRNSVTVSGADIVTRGSSSVFSANGQFNVSNTNALGQSESFQYDPRFAQPTSHTGPNGLTTTWSYDSFGRKIQETRADGTLTKWVYKFCSGVNGGMATCIAGAKYIISQTPYAADGTTITGPYTTVYLDQLDREIARETQGFDGSTVRATKAYNNLGQVTQTSRPYFVSSGTPQYTTFTYDALGRVLTETKPDGGVSQTAYHGLSVTETNALNQTRTVVKNSQGKVISVTDALNNTMTFAYGAVGNPVRTTDAAGNVVTATYDLRSRKIASSDPDLGNWTYRYNTLGLLVSQTDAKSQVTTFNYDKLDRLVQRVEADVTSVWTYDIATNGIGKLASSGITAGAGTGFGRSLTYDTLGRLTQLSTIIDGSTYLMGATYDAQSRLSKVNYPSGFTARYSYNALGFANQLADDATSQMYWAANTMDAEGHLTQTTSGNNIVTNRTFEVSTGRLSTVIAGASGYVQNDYYYYDKLSNPTRRVNANTTVDESFVYDGLNRLTSSTVNLTPTPLAKTFSYSAIGNMLTKSDVGTYNYPAAGQVLPHAVSSITSGLISTTFTYDLNGNQTSGLNRNIAWTSYNKPASITQGTRTISFVDDTEHQRFKQVTPEGTTLYIGGFGVLAEVTNPGTASQKWTDYMSVGNAKVGMRTLQSASETLTTRYFHADHLGSISVITDENALVVERLSYDAWGKRRNLNGTDDTTGSITSQSTRGFTGEEQLSVGSLVHLNGRVYDALLARFTSADPTVTDPMNMQGWNRYSYVGNDPLAFTDPNGFNWFSNAFGWIGKAFTAVGNFIKQNFLSILQIAITAVLSVTPIGPIAAAAIAAAVVTGISGGNLGQILRAAATAAVTAFAFQVVGGATEAFAKGDPSAFSLTNHSDLEFGTPAHGFNVVGHALVGCGSSVASGGSCQSGAMAAAAGAGVGPLMAGQSFATKLVISSVAGGLGSVAGGGKFANGAITGAFGYLFNGAAGKLIGQRLGVAIVGTLGIESGPADVAAAAAGGYIGGEFGSALEDYAAAQKTPNQLGEEGEAAVRGRYNIGDKLPFEINGRSRIADGLIPGESISEIKNVDYQYYSTQLRDYADYASKNGLRFDLYTRPDTALSRPLREAISSGSINRLDIPR